jgi:pescadillo protein
MGTKKRKHTEGAAVQYITRRQATTKLRLSHKDFRRLCILKGVHPREPTTRRFHKSGIEKHKTVYFAKDIRFLLHEPIVWKFRDQNAFMKKYRKATNTWGDEEKVERLDGLRPQYTLDHIVKERYPTFIDAIRDLEDCLCLTFLFSTFPAEDDETGSSLEMINLCRRLSIEFTHYVIEARALRKVFCSIKGYYFQADIKGQVVTWIVPHYFGPGGSDMTLVDVKIMAVFTEFYTTMLGFINFRLYNQLNLTYPPKLQGVEANGTEEDNERVCALNQSLQRTIVEEDVSTLDKIEMYEDDVDIESARKEAESIDNLVKLFNGLKFFLGREVPREPLVFMIRSVGGEVSWDATVQPGSTFKIDDERITHHIADRELIPNKKLGRFYVQPQWIFDSINMRKRLNEKDYALGETLPPHLSPFVDAEKRRVGEYVTPDEAKMQKALLSRDNPEDKKENEEEDSEGDSEGEDEEDSDGVDEEDIGDGMSEEEQEETQESEVKVGQKEKVDKQKVMSQQEKEEWRLREMMIKNKDRYQYKRMMKAQRYRQAEARKMKQKREDWEQENTPAKKKSKKKVKVADE